MTELYSSNVSKIRVKQGTRFKGSCKGLVLLAVWLIECTFVVAYDKTYNHDNSVADVHGSAEDRNASDASPFPNPTLQHPHLVPFVVCSRNDLFYTVDCSSFALLLATAVWGNLQACPARSG
jgi:hypothetical protein